MSEATQTLPSIEDEPMCIEFEAVIGTGACLGPLAEGEPSFALENDCAGDDLCSDAILFTASTLVTGAGGGNGEMDNADIDAEWA